MSVGLPAVYAEQKLEHKRSDLYSLVLKGILTHITKDTFNKWMASNNGDCRLSA